MSSPRLRPALEQLPSYVAGRSVPGADQLTPYKLSSNENPYPPLPGVIEAITKAAGLSHRYPDPASTDLTRALAEHLDVPADHLALGTGSVAVLTHLAQVTCDAGDEILHAWRSFESYPIVAGIVGATSVAVPLRADGTHDLPAFAKHLTDRTRLVLVCTPNNPTSTVVTQAEVDALLGEVSPEVLVVIDEAYAEFVRDPAAVDGLATYRRYPNVAVLRTFSKAYGLAGLRVGYVVAPPGVAAAVRQVSTPFGVSTVAQAAGVASLAAEAQLLERVAALVVERDRVLQALRAQGHQVPEPQGNFVWLPLGDRTAEFQDACARVSLAVRGFGTEGVRITIAEPEANDRMLTVSAGFAVAG